MRNQWVRLVAATEDGFYIEAYRPNLDVKEVLFAGTLTDCLGYLREWGDRVDAERGV